jgi:hypothetical protein
MGVAIGRDARVELGTGSEARAARRTGDLYLDEVTADNQYNPESSSGFITNERTGCLTHQDSSRNRHQRAITSNRINKPDNLRPLILMKFHH